MEKLPYALKSLYKFFIIIITFYIKFIIKKTHTHTHTHTQASKPAPNASNESGTT